MRGHLGGEQSRKQNGHFWRKCDGPYLYQFCTVPPAKICVGKPFKAPLKWYIIHRNWPRGSHARHPAMAPSWWPLPWGRIFRLIFLPYSVAMHTEMYYSIHIYAMHISSSTGYPNRAPERGGREVQNIPALFGRKKAPKKRPKKRPNRSPKSAIKAPRYQPKKRPNALKKRPDKDKIGCPAHLQSNTR